MGLIVENHIQTLLKVAFDLWLRFSPKHRAYIRGKTWDKWYINLFLLVLYLKVVNSVVMNHVTISDGCSIQGSVICSNAQLQERVVLKDCQVFMLTHTTLLTNYFSVSLFSWLFTPGWSRVRCHFWQRIQGRVPGKKREITISTTYWLPGHHIVLHSRFWIGFWWLVSTKDRSWWPCMNRIMRRKTHGGLRNFGHHVIFLEA